MARAKGQRDGSQRARQKSAPEERSRKTHPGHAVPRRQPAGAQVGAPRARAPRRLAALPELLREGDRRPRDAGGHPRVRCRALLRAPGAAAGGPAGAPVRPAARPPTAVRWSPSHAAWTAWANLARCASSCRCSWMPRSKGGARGLRPRPGWHVPIGGRGFFADPAPEGAGSRDASVGDSGRHVRHGGRGERPSEDCGEGAGCER